MANLALTIINSILVFIVILLAFNIFSNKEGFMSLPCTHVESEIDKSSYCIAVDNDQKESSANLLALINQRVVKFMKNVRAKYLVNKMGSAYQQKLIYNIIHKYNPDNIVENSPYRDTNDTSYTVDKGSILALCIRNNPDGSLVELNTMMFVVLHELAHTAINDTSHTPEFWKAFSFILEEAISMGGVYHSVDYSKHPTFYCNMTINSTPIGPKNE